MNVIGARGDRWWNDPGRAMRQMAETLDAFASQSGDQVTVVFDKDPGGLPEVHALRVVIARRKGRNAADHEIEHMVAGDDDAASLYVVTSDRRLVERVRSLGARVYPAGRFRSKLEAMREP